MTFSGSLNNDRFARSYRQMLLLDKDFEIELNMTLCLLMSHSYFFTSSTFRQFYLSNKPLL